jgi:hypothetical protein
MLTGISVRPPYVLVKVPDHCMFRPALDPSRLPPLYLLTLPPLDLLTLPPLPLETPCEVVSFHNYPPLPSPTPEELCALMQVNEQPERFTGDQMWEVLFPPDLTDRSSCADTVYYAILEENRVYIKEAKSWRTHFEVQKTLSVFLHLRSKLRANLLLLQAYGEKGIVNAPAPALDNFGQNHCAIFETLLAIEENLSTHPHGLPGPSEYRSGRNYFSHIFLTPSRDKSLAEMYVKKNTTLYNRLYRQVVTTAAMLDEQLADEDIWALPCDTREPSKVPPSNAVHVTPTWAEAAENGNLRDNSDDSGDDTESSSDESEDAVDDSSVGSSSATVTLVDSSDHEQDSNQVQVQVQTPQQPLSPLPRAFKALYFRSRLVRQMADKLTDFLWNLQMEHANPHSAQGGGGVVAELDYDDGFDAAEDEYAGYGDNDQWTC